MRARLVTSLVLVAGLAAGCSAAGPESPAATAGSPSESTGSTAATGASAGAAGNPGAGNPAATTPGAGTPSPGTPAVGTPIRGVAPKKRFGFVVEERTFRRGNRLLETTIWYPRGGTGPYPLILFSHGLTASPTDYGQLLRRWAQAGFVVAAPAYPHTSYQVEDFNALDVLNQPADASYVIGQLISDPLVDPARVSAAGHSAGGITTVGMLTGERAAGRREARLRSAIVMAGRQVLPGVFAGPSAPVLFVHGKKDTTVPYADGLTAFRAVPWPKAMLAIKAGGHVTTDADFDLVAATTTDFWRWSLYGDAAARGRLDRDATSGGKATLDDELG